MKKMSLVWVFAVLVALPICLCTEPADSAAVEKAGPAPLLVGITPDSPPMIFKRGESIVGLEADFARLLAAELGRPLQFVELEWNQEIPALLNGKIDIIMSGMTITRARQVRIAFSDYYLKSGLVAAMRTEDAAKYTTREKILGSFDSIGVIKGTSGEAYVREYVGPGTRVVTLRDLTDARYELSARRIDLFIHDAPAVVGLVAENESSMKGLWEPLNDEYLGWGLRRDDRELLVQVNAVLAKWKNDGTLRNVTLKWLPYWKRFD